MIYKVNTYSNIISFAYIWKYNYLINVINVRNNRVYENISLSWRNEISEGKREGFGFDSHSDN